MDEEKIMLGDNSKNNQNKKTNIPVNEGTNISVDVESNTNQQTRVKQDIAKEHNIPEQYLDMDFVVPTEEIELPSKGIFYPNNKKTVTIKYLTAEEDDILYSPDLIKSGKVLDVLLDKAVIDKDLRPSDMLSGDRNFILIEMRKTGLGNEYSPGEIMCPSCNQSHEPIIDLSLLKSKPIESMPEDDGEYTVMLPIMKMNIKFRLLNGRDEKRLAKIAESKGKKSAGIKVSRLITEKYIMQIMEVNGNRDKLYIKKFISAMPMKDSAFFREYNRIIEPGLDLSYEFECPNCQEIDIRDIPINPKLFYPDMD